MAIATIRPVGVYKQTRRHKILTRKELRPLEIEGLGPMSLSSLASPAPFPIRLLSEAGRQPLFLFASYRKREKGLVPNAAFSVADVHRKLGGRNVLNSTQHTVWNSLPFIDLRNSFSTIKYYLYSYFWNHFIHNFDPCR